MDFHNRLLSLNYYSKMESFGEIIVVKVIVRSLLLFLGALAALFLLAWLDYGIHEYGHMYIHICGSLRMYPAAIDHLLKRRRSFEVVAVSKHPHTNHGGQKSNLEASVEDDVSPSASLTENWNIIEINCIWEEFYRGMYEEELDNLSKYNT